MTSSKFAIPTAEADRFTKKEAAEGDYVVSFFIVKWDNDVPDKHNPGETTTMVTADVVDHTNEKVHRDSRNWGALARQLKVAPGSIVDGRMGFGKVNDKAIVIDSDAIDDETRAKVEGFYELNAEATENGFRLRDDVTFPAAPAAKVADADEEEPF